MRLTGNKCAALHQSRNTDGSEESLTQFCGKNKLLYERFALVGLDESGTRHVGFFYCFGLFVHEGESLSRQTDTFFYSPISYLTS